MRLPTSRSCSASTPTRSHLGPHPGGTSAASRRHFGGISATLRRHFGGISATFRRHLGGISAASRRHLTAEYSSSAGRTTRLCPSSTRHSGSSRCQGASRRATTAGRSTAGTWSRWRRRRTRCGGQASEELDQAQRGRGGRPPRRPSTNGREEGARGPAEAARRVRDPWRALCV